MLTQNAIGNLVNRYNAVLKKCNLLNTFGTLALASCIAISSQTMSYATSLSDVTQDITSSETYESGTLQGGYAVEILGLTGGDSIITGDSTSLALTGSTSVYKLSEGSLYVEDGATLLLGGSAVAPTIEGSLFIENATIKLVCDKTTYTLYVNGSDGIVLSGNATLNFDIGSTTSSSLSAISLENGNNTITVGTSTTDASGKTSMTSATITINSGLSLENDTLSIIVGTMTVKSLSITDESTVYVGTGTLTVTGASTFNASDFVSDSTEKGIYIDGTMKFSDSLTIVTTENENSIAIDGNLSADSLTISGDEALLFTSGTLTVSDGSAFKKMITGDVVVSGTDAALKLSSTSSGNTTGTVDSITISDGASLSISSIGVTLNKGEVIEIKDSTLTIASGASLDTTSGSLVLSNATVSLNGTLTVNFSDFVTIDDDGDITVVSSITFTNNDGTLVLNNNAYIAVADLKAYVDILEELNSNLYSGTITTDFLTVDDMSENSLDDIPANMTIDLATKSTDAGSGILSGGQDVTISHLTNKKNNETLTVSNGSLLTLTGQGSEDGIVFNGSLEVTGANSVLSIGKVVAPNIVATKTSTYIGGDITISNEGEFIVQNTMLSSEDEDNPINVYISYEGVLTVASNATLDVENIVVSDSKGVSVQVGVSHTDTSEYNTIGLSSLIVTGSITLDGTALVLQNGWYSDLRIGSAAYAVINTFDTEDGMIDGYLLVGQNSYLVLGDTDQSWAQDAFNYSGYLWNDGDNGGSEIEAALFINTPQVLDTDVKASILVDGDLYKNTANMESTSSESGLNGLTLSGSFIGFGENSLLVVNAENLNGEAAISFSDYSSINYFSVADSSQLLIVNAEVDTSITIISGVYINNDDGEVETNVLGGDGTLIVDTGISGWEEENIKSASGLIGIDSVDFIIDEDTKTGSYTVSFVQLDANILYPTASSEIRAMMNNVTASYGDDTESPYAGIAFISRSVNSNYFSATTDSATTIADATDDTTNSNVAANNEVAVANLLEGSVRLSSVVGVANATSKASTLGTNSILERTSLKTPVASRLVSMPLNSSVDTFYAQNDPSYADDMQSEKKSHFVSERGAGIWAMPLYMTSSTDGLSAGSFEAGYDTTVYGAAIGADVTFKDIYFLGLGFNVGSGSSDSTGDFAQSTNDFSFWGMSFYGGVQFDNFGLTIDVGYTTSDNDVQQDMPASMQMSSLTAEVNSSVWTTGLRLEYLLETSYIDFLPYVGVRYSSVRVGDHDIKSKNLNGNYDFSDDTIFIVDGTAQEVYTLPLGLSMSTDFAFADWTISPRVDLGLILAGGDLDATTSWGVSALVGENSKVKTEVFDELTYTGGLGLTAKNDNLSLGLNYKINNSEHETSHMIFGSVRYEFGMEDEPRKTDRASLGEEYGEFLAAQSAASRAPENAGVSDELAPATSAAPSSAFIAVSGTSTADKAKANEDSYELPSVNSSDSYELAPVQASHDAESYELAPVQASHDAESYSTRAASTQESTTNTELAVAYSDGVQAQTNEYGEEYIIIDEDDSDSYALDSSTQDDDVHVLATMEVEKQDVQAGVHSIGGQALQMIPNTTNMITGALKGMSNIQFSNSDMSNQQGGEISPPRISIYGSKPYENNFMIDGMTITNTFNPSGLTDRGNQNDLTVGGGDQDIFYDTNLVERIDVYTNNVPARFGNFNGGVVDATLRDPRKDKWRFRVSGNTTDSKWYSIGDVDKDSETADAQPVYSIYKFSGTAEGPINDTVSMLMGYTNVYSIIPLTMRNSLGEYSVKDQRRMSENFFVKTLIEPSDDLRFTVDMTYAPYEEYRWREYWVNSEYTTDNETIRLAGTMKYSASLGDVETKLSLMNSGYSYHATSNSIYQETGLDDDTLYSGGYGDRETNKTDVNSTISFTSHDFKAGWLNWNFETGVNIAFSSLGIEAENALVDVKVYNDGDDAGYRYTEAIYNDVDSYDALTTLGYYFQTQLKVDRFTFTPGFRIDTDDFTGNVDIAPRLKLEVDTFDNKMLNFMVGYNRYYGTALREYAFDRTRSAYFYNWEYDENDNVYSTEGGNKVNSVTKIDLDGLETPYSDEFTTGVFGTVLGVDYKLDYTYRDHRNQLLSVEDEIRTIMYEGSGFSQTVEKLTNNGHSTYRGLTLTLERGFDFGSLGKHIFGLGATISKTKTFNGSYDDTVELDYSGYTAVQNTSKVYYNEELIDKSDLPAEDYNAPLTLTFTWQTSFFDDRLRFYSLNRWKDDSKGIMLDSRSDKNTPYGTVADGGESSYWYTDESKSEFATAYKKGIIRGGLISDINIEYDVLKHEDYTLGLSFDMYNIFNTNIGVSATEDGSGGTDSVRRSFWLGVYATF